MAKILIVDDDKGATDLLARIVATDGHVPTTVNESKKAIEIANQVEPDLIILDLMMPEPTGFQLCRMLREMPKYLFTPILIVTALDDTDSRVVAFGAGADDYVTKPIHIEELTQRIRELLDAANA